MIHRVLLWIWHNLFLKTKVFYVTANTYAKLESEFILK